MSRLYGRIGTRVDVDKRLNEAREFSRKGYDLEILEDSQAQTAQIKTDGGKVTLFSALHKGDGVWLCMYSPSFYPK